MKPQPPSPMAVHRLAVQHLAASRPTPCPAAAGLLPLASRAGRRAASDCRRTRHSDTQPLPGHAGCAGTGCYSLRSQSRAKNRASLPFG